MIGLISRRLFLALPLAGCAAEGEKYLPDSISVAKGMGTIYVYRPLSDLGKRGEDPFVSIAGKSYGRMKAGSYIAATFPEGDFKVTVQQSVFMLVPTIPKSVEVTVVRGSQSYVRVDQSIDSVGMTGGVSVSQSTSIEEVPFDVGQAELAKTRKNS
jgi:Protein of unknown function (DUF2846)